MLTIKNIYEVDDFPIEIEGSPAWANHLLHSAPFSELEVDVTLEDCIGADMLRLPAGSRYPAHTHHGHHLLLIVEGRGTVTYGGKVYDTKPGDIYIMDGATEHAVGATDDHKLISIGVPHRMPGTDERMELTDTLPPVSIPSFQVNESL